MPKTTITFSNFHSRRLFHRSPVLSFCRSLARLKQSRRVNLAINMTKRKSPSAPLLSVFNTDLDGTFLPESSDDIPAANPTALSRLRQTFPSCNLILNTGRSLRHCDKVRLYAREFPPLTRPARQRLTSPIFLFLLLVKT